MAPARERLPIAVDVGSRRLPIPRPGVPFRRRRVSGRRIVQTTEGTEKCPRRPERQGSDRRWSGTGVVAADAVGEDGRLGQPVAVWPPRPRQGRRRRLGAPRGRQAVGRRGKGWPKWFLRKTRVACYCGLYGRNRPAPNEAGRRYGRIRPPPRAELRSVSRLRAVAGPPARDEPSSGVPPVRLFYQPRLMDASSSNARKGFSRKNVSRSP